MSGRCGVTCDVLCGGVWWCVVLTGWVESHYCDQGYCDTWCVFLMVKSGYVASYGISMQQLCCLAILCVTPQCAVRAGVSNARAGFSVASPCGCSTTLLQRQDVLLQ
jgi:hypothetical protein